MNTISKKNINDNNNNKEIKTNTEKNVVNNKDISLEIPVKKEEGKNEKNKLPDFLKDDNIEEENLAIDNKNENDIKDNQSKEEVIDEMLEDKLNGDNIAEIKEDNNKNKIEDILSGNNNKVSNDT